MVCRPIAHWHPLYGENAKGDIDQTRSRLVARFGEERTFRMADTSRNLLIYPNLAIVDGSAVTVRIICPVAPDRMDITAWNLGPTEETAEQKARRMLTWGFTEYESGEPFNLVQFTVISTPSRCFWWGSSLSRVHQKQKSAVSGSLPVRVPNEQRHAEFVRASWPWGDFKTALCYDDVRFSSHSKAHRR